ncbi:hypothetical protein M378DRAFT_186154 [Amanita muscaria Koide BX008]|uniref:RING-type domain-containing protein n=1 Tax=Amanita muscaria (strain Koide BX008) TaxID=946122 RepID=A0A0C2X9S5_AMAMK|nr:hypothetical protein M378DRAFT_186154 [Amanita muscaria Koide BX008]
MTKHSKNNTASSIFSYAEYKKLNYGTKKQRLGNESMRNFDACALCLNRARDPLSCGEGHLFCKECVYTDLLTQKTDMKKQKDRLEALKREAEEERERARMAARERVLLEFEKGQLTLASSSIIGTKPTVSSNSSEREYLHTKFLSPHRCLARGTKRKFEFDTSAVEKMTKEAEEAALRQIEKEQAEALKHKLPDFWLPSLTPTYQSSGPPQSLSDVKVQTTSTFSLKNLFSVKFTIFETNASSSKLSESTPAEGSASKVKEDGEPMCPSCKKRLSNNSLIYVMKPCGHVTCKTCVDTLVRPSKQCIVCDTQLKDKDIIELKREGTGFAGGGMAETSKAGVAFQG